MAQGEEPPEFSGIVTEPNEDFSKWVSRNEARIKQATSLPYWYKDNTKYVKPVPSAKLRVISASECNIKLSNGGSVSTPELRLAKGNRNKQSRAIFEKELRMAKRFANIGHKIEFAADDTGSFDVLIDGIKADLKSTSSPGNIIKYAKHATREQGADIVLFEFTNWGASFIEEIKKLEQYGIHGKYLKPGDSRIYKF